MLKRAFTVILAALFVMGLMGCSDKKEGTKGRGNQNITKEETVIFTNSAAIEKLGLEWIFVPSKSTELKTKDASTKKLELSFKGCGYKEINRYAADMEKAIQKSGYALYSPVLDEGKKLVDIEKATPVTSVIEDEYFSGTAYNFVYKTADAFVTVTVKYYGSAGGKYGNGQCKVVIQDSTDLYMPYYEEAQG